MSKIKKRSDGRFVKRVSYAGRKVDVYGKTQKEVEEKAFLKLQELKENKVNHDNPTLDKYHEKWVENRRDSVRPATIRSQQCHYNTISEIKISGKRLGDFRLSEISVDDIRQIQKVLATQNSAQTTNDKLAFLSHVFHDALLERLIDFNPCTPVKPLKRSEKKARDAAHRALSKNEIKAFFEHAEKSYYLTVYRFAIQTGMRVGEIGALRNSDICGDIIHVNRTITRLEDGSYTIGDATKTWSGKRQIPLNAEIKNIIEKQRAINAMLDGNISGFDDLLFKAPERGLLSATPIDRDIKRICKRAGIEPFTAHAFRSTFATLAVQAGVQPKTLQELMGHSNFSLTMTLYAHAMDECKQQAMEMLKIVV